MGNALVARDRDAADEGAFGGKDDEVGHRGGSSRSRRKWGAFRGLPFRANTRREGRTDERANGISVRDIIQSNADGMLRID